jgi:hypothetical protein
MTVAPVAHSRLHSHLHPALVHVRSIIYGTSQCFLRFFVFFVYVPPFFAEVDDASRPALQEAESAKKVVYKHSIDKHTTHKNERAVYGVCLSKHGKHHQQYGEEQTRSRR